MLLKKPNTLNYPILFGYLGDLAKCSRILHEHRIFSEHSDDAIRNDEKSFLRIYFKSNIKFQQTIYDYTLLSLLAEIGGYTGLLLGISVANITTVIEKMFQWFNLVA